MFVTPYTRAKNPNVLNISILGEGRSTSIDPAVPGDIWFDITVRARGPNAANATSTSALPQFAPVEPTPVELAALPPPGMYELFPDTLITVPFDVLSLGTTEASPE